MTVVYAYVKSQVKRILSFRQNAPFRTFNGKYPESPSSYCWRTPRRTKNFILTKLNFILTKKFIYSRPYFQLSKDEFFCDFDAIFFQFLGEFWLLVRNFVGRSSVHRSDFFWWSYLTRKIKYKPWTCVSNIPGDLFSNCCISISSWYECSCGTFIGRIFTP